MEAKERRELAKLAEKHQAYDDAFQAQMEHYKSHGRVEGKSRINKIMTD